MEKDTQIEQIIEFFDKFYFQVSKTKSAFIGRKSPGLDTKQDIVIYPNDIYLNRVFGSAGKHMRDYFYIAEDSCAINLFYSLIDNNVETNPEELIKHAFEYIESSFKEETATYNETIFAKIFNALDFLGIKYSKITTEEMERCLMEVEERSIPYYIYWELYKNKKGVLASIKLWVEIFEDACSEVTTDKLYYELISPFKNICEELEEIVNGRSHNIDSLLSKIEELKIEILKIRKEVAKPENCLWALNRDGECFIKSYDLPHEQLIWIIQNALVTFIPKTPKVVDEEDEFRDDCLYGDYTRVQCDFIRTLCTGKYDEFLLWDEGKADEIYSSHMYYFYEHLIHELSIFIKYLKAYDLILDGTIPNTYFYQLFDFFINTVNESLSKKEQNELTLNLSKD